MAVPASKQAHLGSTNETTFLTTRRRRDERPNPRRHPAASSTTPRRSSRLRPIRSEHPIPYTSTGADPSVAADASARPARRPRPRDWHRKFVPEVLGDGIRRSLELRHGVAELLVHRRRHTPAFFLAKPQKAEQGRARGLFCSAIGSRKVCRLQIHCLSLSRCVKSITAQCGP